MATLLMKASICLVLVLHFIHGVSGITCLRCENVKHLKECTDFITCPADQTCSIQSQVNDSSSVNNPSVTYTAGCRKIMECNLMRCAGEVSMGRKRDNEVVCIECCYNDTCNTKGCGASFREGSDNDPSPYCFDCEYIHDNSSCHTFKQCDQNYACVSSVGTSPVQNEANTVFPYYNLGCMRQLKCDILAANGFSETAQCCNTDFCNFNPLATHPVDPPRVCPTGLVRPTTTTVATTTPRPTTPPTTTPPTTITTSPPPTTPPPPPTTPPTTSPPPTTTPPTTTHSTIKRTTTTTTSPPQTTLPPTTTPPTITHSTTTPLTTTSSTTTSTQPPTTLVTTVQNPKPCEDAPDGDCSNSAVLGFICQHNDTAERYCKRSCGLCPPPCEDAPDGDCSNSAVLGFICQHSDTAERYCKRSCGLCPAYSRVTTPRPPMTTTSKQLTAECPRLSMAHLHATINDYSTSVGSVAIIQCISGYTQQGSARRTCQADGTWSGTDTICKLPSTQLRSQT